MCFLCFILFYAIYTYDTHTYTSQLAMVDTTFYIWIFSSINNLLTSLAARKQGEGYGMGSWVNSVFVCHLTYTYIHTYIHTHIHTYIHTHIHTYTHTHIHTYIGVKYLLYRNFRTVLLVLLLFTGAWVLYSR
jgi:hypothetical protein